MGGSGSALAHEVWLDAESYTPATGDTIRASLRNGERFGGVELSYNPSSFERFDVRTDGSERPLAGRLGDRPAVTFPDAPNGLMTLIHQSDVSTLTYRVWAKFESFIEHKDFRWATDAHQARGLPETGFKEAYARYVKALIGVGDGAGADAATGLETEIVALSNPYTEVTDSLPVLVLYQGAPRRGAQVELFDRGPDGAVTVSLHRTDDAGIAVLPVTPGHTYLADAVVLREPDSARAKETGAVWETLWAALTFAVPAR